MATPARELDIAFSWRHCWLHGRLWSHPLFLSITSSHPPFFSSSFFVARKTTLDWKKFTIESLQYPILEEDFSFLPVFRPSTDSRDTQTIWISKIPLLPSSRIPSHYLYYTTFNHIVFNSQISFWLPVPWKKTWRRLSNTWRRFWPESNWRASWLITTKKRRFHTCFWSCTLLIKTAPRFIWSGSTKLIMRFVCKRRAHDRNRTDVHGHSNTSLRTLCFQFAATWSLPSTCHTQSYWYCVALPLLFATLVVA